MIKLNLNNSQVTIKNLNKLQPKIDQIHQKLLSKKGVGSEMTEWLDIAANYDQKLLMQINDSVKKLKNSGVEILLTIGIGGSFLGAQAASDFILGAMESQEKLLFAGINMSSSHYKQLEKKLKNKKWAICVISKSGTTLEPALAFRHFKKLLAKKYGTQNVYKYIIAITDKEKGALKNLADQSKYTTFSIPDGVGGRFSVITPVGLYPLAFCGVDLKKFMEGLKDSYKDLTADSNLKNNIAYRYAVTRYLLHTKNKKVLEIFTTYDFDLTMFGEWWKQLFGESEGKNNKSLFPTSVAYSRDLHSLGQSIQQGTKSFLETTLWVVNDKIDIKVSEDLKDLDGLNYLAGQSLNEINRKAFQGVVQAHSKEGNNPNIIIEIEDKTPYSLGYLFFFFFMAVSISAYLLKVNPFNQPGVEIYKKNMFNLLKK